MKQFFLFSCLSILPFLGTAQVKDSTLKTATNTAAPAPTAPPATQVPPTSDHVKRMRFGAYVAPTINWMKPTASTDDSKTYDVKSGGSQVGFIYGLMMDYYFAENYALVTGLQVNQTGGHIISTNRDQSVTPNKILKSDFTYHLQYLEIPFNLKLRTDDMNKVRFFGQAGLSLSINISRKVDYTVSYVPNQQGATVMEASGEKVKLQGDISAVAPVILQMNLGAGLEYAFSPKLSGYVGLFFNNGFAPDATNPENFKTNNMGYPINFDDGNTRLNNFALRLGLFF